MRHFFTLLFLILSINCFSQGTIGTSSHPWIGPVSSAGTIYRVGNVGIGTSSAPTAANTALTVQTNGTEGLPLQMGKYISSIDKWTFNFGMSNTYAGITVYDMNGNNRMAFSSNSNTTYYTIDDQGGNNIFKVSRDPSLGSYIHMPYANSKIVIGGYGNYLSNEDHKLIVKDGNALIEGNLGIGTSSFLDGLTTYRLSVDGKIRAEGVKVYTDWADYVFENSYNLLTIEEVESFIAKNGHLKDIPSAEEVEKNGIELGEMNKLLLQKIEELTLYVIDLNKEIELLKKGK